MKSTSEQDITRIFDALRDTELSPGMEARILRVVQERASSPSVWNRWSLGWRWSVAAFAIATAVLVLSWTRPGSHTAEPGLANSTTTLPAAVPMPVNQVAEVQHPHPSSKSTKIVRTSEPLCDCDPLALAEMRAPSRPAPPMSLTADERLLLRAVHREDQINLAQLDLMPRPSSGDSEDRAIEQFVKRNLASLAFAESFNPTPPTPAANDTLPPGDAPLEPEIPTSSPNN